MLTFLRHEGKAYGEGGEDRGSLEDSLGEGIHKEPWRLAGNHWVVDTRPGEDMHRTSSSHHPGEHPAWMSGSFFDRSSCLGEQ